MKTRAEHLNSFIQKYHLTNVIWLCPDASTRRYARVERKGKNYILMDSPLSEKPKEFVKIDTILRKYKVPVPKIYAKNLRHGFVLLEDFGDLLLSQAIQKNASTNDLYILALDTLIGLQKRVKDRSKLPDAFKLMAEQNDWFIDYYAPYVLKKPLSQKAKDEFHRIWHKLFLGMHKIPKTLVLYDFHMDNIMVKSDGSLGLLDFQDAMEGPIFYDLISFVEDERHPLPIKTRRELLNHYFELRPVLGSKHYADWVDVVSAHRHTRVIGNFVKLAIESKKKNYLKYIKNDWMFLRENLKNPLLKEYKDWLKKYFPNQLKG